MPKIKTGICLGLFILLLNIPASPIQVDDSGRETVENSIEIVEEVISTNNIKDQFSAGRTLPIPDIWPPFKSDSPYKRIIVEFDLEPVGVKKGILKKSGVSEGLLSEKITAYYNKVEGEHALFNAGLERLDIDFEILWDYFNAYNGLGLVLHEGDIGKIQKLPGVTAVHFDQLGQGAISDTVKTIGADRVWQMKNETGEYLGGDGVIIAVLDTGIEYTHKELGGGMGTGFKVIDGYDFVNKDNDPMDDNFHGTMVSGIIGADRTLRGVAPNASL
ncbi:MAG: S8 family serine peptidase, partial [Thermoplasmata archaeon]